MDDTDVLQHISSLVEEEKRLRSTHDLDDAGRERVREIEVRLDQYWDLLRRREAREEFGQDPDLEGERSPEVVENYRQ